MDDDEWDLHAVVRSCSTAISSGTNATATADDGLDNVASRNDTNPYSSYDNPLEEVYKEGCSQSVDDEQEQPSVFDHASDHSLSIQSPTKKRKNQEKKKMVVELTQAELCNDTWAWRKYGQKPIKGSPFPRNYYKCSTTKACGARKQVEQSHMDPTIFIVSYSGEHIHPRPTHRSPLAGSTRSNKFTMPMPMPMPTHNNIPPITDDTAGHSPCADGL